MEVLFLLPFVLAFVGLPLYLTVYNTLLILPKRLTRRIFSKAKDSTYIFRRLDHERRKQLRCVITVMWGALLSLIYLFGFIRNKDWDEPVILGGGDPGWHRPISEKYWLSFEIPFLLAAIALIILIVNRLRKPPLKSAVLISLTLIGNLQLVMLTVQLIRLSDYVFLPIAVYAYNFIIITARVMREEIRDQLGYLAHNADEENTSAVTRKLYRLLDSSKKWVLAVFILMLPLLGVLTVVLVLFGQGPGGMIKAFTETADWTFSQKTPPPPEYYEGHYLCTAAAGGHRRIVKPTRYGIRRGERIIVNRQLCIANAFEELIQERTPRLHRHIRSFYDTHGYPIAKKMTTQARNDLVYILMKPLEWLFLLALYAFDTDPEGRIAVQYTGRGIRDMKTER
ncbi:MAG: hypothetical protein IJ746_04195 [Ruminococcus sp.]|nr:hypothetical protein [Ruminococcus sp.]